MVLQPPTPRVEPVRRPEETVAPDSYAEAMPGLWQYLLHHWDPDSGVSMEDWAQDLADRGWVVWGGPGGWTTHNGQRVWRVSLRREPEFLKAELRERRQSLATS